MTMTAAAHSLEPTCPPPDPNPKRPALPLPPRACDSHFHVFGPHARFPYAATRTFTPHDAPTAQLLALHQFLGFARGLVVQSSCHGTDHSAMLDLLAAGNGNYRGVALLTPSTRREEVARLSAAGVCGVRFHFLPHLGTPASLDDMGAIIGLVEPDGWHIALHVTGRDMVDHFGFIASIALPVIVDHIGRVDVNEGPNGQGFVALRRLLDTGKVWVKLSGTDRASNQAPPFRDAVALARILAQHAPDRVLWGTDWPHPNIVQMPNDGELVDLIAEIAVDETTRRKMLVDNPAKLFGFD